MTVTRIFSIALFTALGLTMADAVAQTTLKVGVVSVPRLLQDAPQAKAVMEALQEEFAPRQRSILAKEQEFQEKAQRIQRDLEVMSDAEKKSAERDLREDRREIERLKSEFIEDQNLRRNEELVELQSTLLREVDEFAREGNYDLIIGDGVLFANQAVNVTDEILAAMQSNFSQSGEGGRK